MTTQEISNLSWALAKLGSYHFPLLKAISAQSISRIAELNRQELSVTAWSFATLGLRPKPLLSAISAQARARITEFGMLEVSNTAWAYATLGLRVEPLMHAISVAARRLLEGGQAPDWGPDPHGIYSIVWSAWRATRPQLAGLARRRGPALSGGRQEPLVDGLFIMDGEWSKDAAGEGAARASLGL